MKIKYPILLVFCLLLSICSQAQSTAKNSLSKDLVKPRMRVIVDNDFSGDPDGLFQLVHQILSPSAEIKGIIGSHLKLGDGFDSSSETATNAVKKVKELLEVMKLQNSFPVYEGSNLQLKDSKTPNISEGAKAIVKEAMRTDVKTPLYVVCGAGLTEIASAYLMEPKIADRLILVWIGGPEYTDLASPPPGYTSLEYNLGIDIKAGQVVFNDSKIPIWQVPRNAYRQTLLSYSELLLKVKSTGITGEYLSEKIESLMKRVQQFDLHIGETYIMGDSPLVLLTALQSSFESDPSSSFYVLKPSPLINAQGLYETNPNGRNIRVYNQLDTRLMFEDFFAKLQLSKI
ncbi:nucleoside hydrolase [Flavobacterium ginsenosidimutans]|uniref:nucleoside hydrolase n=1 Tax=Flavobacterium ginsenosidimutans TaxID=687844 RepID=UPI000DAD619D|nr:nucleoside hydrolase [Flavobacterium ginsenosidimutans]KAF2336590.1 nucleoside hydrolase [Flavobacterium ginsenosidimutans]